MGKRLSMLPLVIMIIAVAVFAGSQSFYVLENAEQAVIERFGQMVNVVNTPGLNFKLPFIDRVRIINTNKIYSVQYGYRPDADATPDSEPQYRDVEDEQLVLTKGSFLVNIGAVIQYKITDAPAYLYNVDDQSGTLRLAFESVLRRNIQDQELENALINKDSIAREILPELSAKVGDYGLGITILDVKFTDVLLPGKVQFAYDDVNIAENQKTEFTSKAEKYRNEQLPGARAEAYDRIQKAEAYKAEKVSQAKGDVENFLQVYEKYASAKDITKKRLYIETMETILSKVKQKYIIDIDGDGTIKYLPLNPGSINQ